MPDGQNIDRIDAYIWNKCEEVSSLIMVNKIAFPPERRWKKDIRTDIWNYCLASLLNNVERMLLAEKSTIINFKKTIANYYKTCIRKNSKY